MWSNPGIHRDSVSTPEYCRCIASHSYASCLPIQAFNLIKSQTSDSSDSCPYVEGGTYDDPKEDQTSTCSDENNDHSDKENIDLSGSNSESSCTNNDVHEFLIPDHENTPDPNDMWS